MKIRVTVENYAGEIIHDRTGTIGARYPSTIKAAHTRIIKILMRIYAGQWKNIAIKKVEDTTA